MAADSRRAGKPLPIGAILPDVLEGLGVQERLRERRLLAAYPEIVGPRIARHSRAVDLADGVLTLQADHPVWRQELVMLFPRIQAGYNERFGPGSVREICWDRRRPRRRPSARGR